MKFETGARVYIPRTQRYGTVVACINESDRRDIEKQGYRYYVDSSGFRWSCSWSELKSYSPRKDKSE